MAYVCPVCGYPGLEDPPRGASGAGSLEICPSCGFQFGKTDDDDGWSYAAWRERWIADGMPWDRGSDTARGQCSSPGPPMPKQDESFPPTMGQHM